MGAPSLLIYTRHLNKPTVVCHCLKKTKYSKHAQTSRTATNTGDGTRAGFTLYGASDPILFPLKWHRLELYHERVSRKTTHEFV